VKHLTTQAELSEANNALCCLVYQVSRFIKVNASTYLYAHVSLVMLDRPPLDVAWLADESVPR
jgi:hypothetical protein